MMAQAKQDVYIYRRLGTGSYEVLVDEACVAIIDRKDSGDGYGFLDTWYWTHADREVEGFMFSGSLRELKRLGELWMNRLKTQRGGHLV